MTVGISFTNGLEAIVVTDSRVSGAGRKSDSVNKMGRFDSDNYFGVIFGSGEGDKITGVIDNLEEFKGEYLDDYVKAIHESEEKRQEEDEQRFLGNQKRIIEQKAKLIDGPEKRKHFQEQETGNLIQRYDNFKQDSANHTPFILVAYDREKDKIRSFLISDAGYNELFRDHIELGSGSDGAHMYFSTKLQGVDVKNLKPEELAFFATNAYGFAAVNEGVGGKPKIARINKDGANIVESERTNALINLSGAYLSESGFGNKATRERFKEILDSGNPDYEGMAGSLGSTKNDLTTKAIPYSTWQEGANGKLFNGKEKTDSK